MAYQDKAFLLRFGKRIRALRKQKGWSQEYLGLECDLDQTYISGIERGQRNVSLLNIQAIARSLDVTLSSMFAGLDEDVREETAQEPIESRPLQ